MRMSFRWLPPEEIKKFEDHARETYEPFSPINGLWHPIAQAECVKINVENSDFIPDRKEEEDGEK